MSDTQTIRLMGTTQRQYAVECVGNAPQGYVVKVGPETRSDAQNRLLHALIGDIRQQVPDARAYSVDDMKLRFMAALRAEPKYLPVLEGVGLFPVGQRTSLLNKRQFSDLIEIIYHYGARNGVRWSDKGRAAFAEAGFEPPQRKAA